MTLHLTYLLTVSFSVVGKRLCAGAHCIIIEIQPAVHNPTTPCMKKRGTDPRSGQRYRLHVDAVDAVVGSPTNAPLS